MNSKKNPFLDNRLNLKECIKQLSYIFRHQPTIDKIIGIQHTIFIHYFNLLSEQPENIGVDRNKLYAEAIEPFIFRRNKV